jgi:hypothetical protein
MPDLDLPPSDTVRWSPYRKALVVDGVRSGVISIDEACRRYQLSADELRSWQTAISAHGVGALRVTRLQYYRDASAADGRGLRARRGVLKAAAAGPALAALPTV